MDKKRIVFFGSGKFPIPTFELMVKLTEDYEVVGLVTSREKSSPQNGVFSLKDIAEEHNIPVYIPSDLKSKEFINWLSELSADIFCVISYKFLPKEVLDTCNGIAYNIHASLLPYLRGAAPINWAIRLDFKETGLTAFKLNDKIDCGGIFRNSMIKVSDDETFGSLFDKLSNLCVLFNDSILSDIVDEELYVNVRQGEIPSEYEKLPVFHAPKLNINNTTIKINYTNHRNIATDEVDRIIRSLSPNIGTTFNLQIYETISGKPLKKITFKVYEAKLLEDKDVSDNNNIITDWKNYFYLAIPNLDDSVISVRKIQLPGKKILDVKEFLKGFQNFKNENYTYKLC